MGAMSLNFSSSVIGISYGEMNSIKSNLRRANDMLMQSQSKVNSARLKVQVDRGSSRLRVSEEQLNDLYTNAAKRKTKIDKLCNNIDITIRKFKEVDARCAARIRAIGKSYDKDKSLWERIKSYVSSFFSHGASSLKSMYETGMDAFNALKKDTVEAYNAASEWMKEHPEVMDALEIIGGVAQTAAYAFLLADPLTAPIALIGMIGTTFSASSTLESISKLINYSSTGKNEGINVLKMGFEGLGELVGGEKGKSAADGVFSTIDTVTAIGGLFIDGGLTISKAGQVMKNSEESISVFKALSEGAKLAEDLKYNALTDLLKGPFKGSLDNLIDVGKNFKDIFIPPTNFGKMCFAGIDDVSMGRAGAIEKGLGKAGALDGLSRNAEILGMISRITEIGSEFIGGGEPSKVGSEADKLTSIINRVKEIRSELPSKLKKSGNFGYAEAEVDGIQQREFFAHSSIDTAADKGALSGMSFKPEGEPIYKAKKVDPDNARIDTPEAYLRDYDTEYKILNDIAGKLKGNEDATGTINLFTERYTCASCSDIILKFRHDHPNIKLNILTNDGKVVR
jgi:hypothetical protein